MTKPKPFYGRGAAVALVRQGWRLARTELGAAAALMVAALGLWGFMEIADEVSEAANHLFDWRVLEAMRQAGQPAALAGPDWLHRAAREFTGLGDTTVLTAITLAVIGFLAIQRKFATAALVALSIGGGSLLSEALKSLFARDRPPEAYRLAEVYSDSFPSGHAMLSAVTYLTLGVLLARVMPRRRLKVYVVGVGVLFALLVGLTRVYLGVHWLTDVLAGWSLGAAWAMACWLVAYGLGRRARSRLAREVSDG